MRVFRAAKELGFNTVRAAPCTCRLQQLAPNKEKCTLQLQHGSLTCKLQHTRKCAAAHPGQTTRHCARVCSGAVRAPNVQVCHVVLTRIALCRKVSALRTRWSAHAGRRLFS